MTCPFAYVRHSRRERPVFAGRPEDEFGMLVTLTLTGVLCKRLGKQDIQYSRRRSSSSSTGVTRYASVSSPELDWPGPGRGWVIVIVIIIQEIALPARRWRDIWELKLG